MFDTWWPQILLGIVAAPVVATIGFSLWMKRSGIAGDLAVKAWEAFIKLVGALTIIAGGAFAYGRYVDERADDRGATDRLRQREVEIREAEVLLSQFGFERERHDRHRRLLSEARTTAAFLANHPNGDDARVARFEELYYAELIGIESRPVELAMIAFKDELDRVAGSGGSNRLTEHSLTLSRAVNEQLLGEETSLMRRSAEIAAKLGSDRD